MTESMPPLTSFRGALYIAPDRLNQIAHAIARAEPCAVTGEIGPCEIKMALGEFADIWPASLLNDAIDERLAELGVSSA